VYSVELTAAEREELEQFLAAQPALQINHVASWGWRTDTATLHQKGCAQLRRAEPSPPTVDELLEAVLAEAYGRDVACTARCCALCSGLSLALESPLLRRLYNPIHEARVEESLQRARQAEEATPW
jgi:hypothetical protein